MLNDPRPPAGASRGERLYVAYCAGCHGIDGRGSWRAALFLIRPGDLTVVANHPDQYVFDIIKHGGASIGRPGMPAFGAQLSLRGFPPFGDGETWRRSGIRLLARAISSPARD